MATVALIPGIGFVQETFTGSGLVPGGGFLNETASVGGSVTTASIVSTDGADIASAYAATWMTASIVATDGADITALATSSTTGAQITVVDAPDVVDIIVTISSATSAIIIAIDGADVAAITAEVVTAALIITTDAADQIYLGGKVTTGALIAVIDGADIAAITVNSSIMLVLTYDQAIRLEAVCRLHGLIAPVTFTPTSRGDGVVTQAITGSGTLLITTTALPAASILDASLLDKLSRYYGLISPMMEQDASRSDGTLTQTVATVGDTTTVTSI